MRGDPVAQWFDLTAAAVAEAYRGPVESSRIWAITWLAALRAVRRIRLGGRGSAAAAATAIHDVLVTLVPSMAADIDRACRIGTARGAATGRLAATDSLADRAADGPNAARWQPFLITSVADVAPPPPDDVRYAADLAEVRTLGAATSTARTSTQTATARAWAAGAPQMYTGALRAALDRLDAPLAGRVELVAFVHLITLDSQIAASAAGEIHPCWPPERAFAAAVTGRWTPLIRAAVGEPAYPCPHAAYAGAAEIVLTALAGHPPEGDWRHLTANRVDAGVWGGTHVRWSGETGAALGRRVAFGALRRWSARDRVM